MNQLQKLLAKDGAALDVMVALIWNESEQKMETIIIDGERRYRCMEALGYTHIPCLIKYAQDNDHLYELSAMANLGHLQHNAIEKARICQRMIDNRLKHHIPKTEAVTQVAEQLNMTVAYVYQYLMILDLPEDMQQAFMEIEVPHSHIINLAKEYRKRGTQFNSARFVSTFTEKVTHSTGPRQTLTPIDISTAIHDSTKAALAESMSSEELRTLELDRLLTKYRNALRQMVQVAQQLQTLESDDEALLKHHLRSGFKHSPTELYEQEAAGLKAMQAIHGDVTLPAIEPELAIIPDNRLDYDSNRFNGPYSAAIDSLQMNEDVETLLLVILAHNADHNSDQITRRIPVANQIVKALQGKGFENINTSHIPPMIQRINDQIDQHGLMIKTHRVKHRTEIGRELTEMNGYRLEFID